MEDHNGEGEPIAEIDESAIEDDEEPFDFQQVLDSRIVQWRDSDDDATVDEPDAPGDSDYAGTDTQSETWQTHEPLDTGGFGMQRLQEHVRDEILDEVEAAIIPDIAVAADDTAMIDEDILREMVADIVRQELQGALGERITRNVRKLVRREIHRALAAHDLD